jgi:hypothetical protein
MKHFTEEELVEIYYSRGARAAERHLEDCAVCAEAFAALKSDLAGMQFAEPPARDAGYGDQIWKTLSSSLAVYEKQPRRWLSTGLWKGLSYAAACALLVAGAFQAGRMWDQRQTQSTAANHPAQPQPQAHQAPPAEHVVVVVLSDHLDQSERLLVELKHVDADSEEMVSPLRDEARALLAANRICRKDATKSDDAALKMALARLDHVLAELAAQRGHPDPATITRLQDEMSADGLLFDVRVLRSRIPDEQRAPAVRQNGGTI